MIALIGLLVSITMLVMYWVDTNSKFSIASWSFLTGVWFIVLVFQLRGVI